MDKILTISVAAYNISKYIEKLMDSLIASNVMEKLEIIIVNDGSKDNTLELAKKYQEIYPDTVRVIDKENGGHGSTINTGIKNAKAKYFRALDGDDWVDSEALSILVQKLENEEVDLVLTDYYLVYQETGKHELVENVGYPIDKPFKFDEFCGKDRLEYHKVIYNSELLKKYNIELTEKCFYEDTEYICLPMIHVETVVYYHMPVYCYRIGYNEQSVSAESRRKHVDDMEKVADRIIQCYLDNVAKLNENRKNYLLMNIAIICRWHLETLASFPAGQDSKKRVIIFWKKYKDALKSCGIDIIRSILKGEVGRRQKLLLVCPQLFYSIYVRGNSVTS